MPKRFHALKLECSRLETTLESIVRHSSRKDDKNISEFEDFVTSPEPKPDTCKKIIIQLLYLFGVIGIQFNPSLPLRWSFHADRVVIDVTEITEKTIVEIYPVFYNVLNISSNDA